MDSNRLSAEVAVEHSSILLENDKDSDVVCARCLKEEIRPNYVVVQAVKVSVIAADIRLALPQPDVQIYPISKPIKLTDKAYFVLRTSCECVL